MCRFITAVIPAEVDFIRLIPIKREYRMSFDSISNEHVKKQIGPNSYVRLTADECDCLSIVGLNSPKEQFEHKEGVSEEYLHKLKKKGWSQSKIDRWLSEKERAIERNEAETEKDCEIQLARWMCFFENVLFDGKLKWIGLLSHCYSDSLDSEKVNILRVEHLVFCKDLEKLLPTLSDNVLYIVSVQSFDLPDALRTLRINR